MTFTPHWETSSALVFLCQSNGPFCEVQGDAFLVNYWMCQSLSITAPTAFL